MNVILKLSENISKVIVEFSNAISKFIVKSHPEQDQTILFMKKYSNNLDSKSEDCKNINKDFSEIGNFKICQMMSM